MNNKFTFDQPTKDSYDILDDNDNQLNINQIGTNVSSDILDDNDNHLDINQIVQN